MFEHICLRDFKKRTGNAPLVPDRVLSTIIATSPGFPEDFLVFLEQVKKQKTSCVQSFICGHICGDDLRYLLALGVRRWGWGGQSLHNVAPLMGTEIFTWSPKTVWLLAQTFPSL